MAGLRQFLGGVALVILFGVAMFAFSIGMIAENNPNSTIISDPYVNSTYSGLKDSANSLQTIGENSKTLLTSYQPTPTYIFLIVYSAFAIPLSFLAFLVTGTGRLLSFIFVSIFGSGNNAFNIVLGVISGILMIAIVLLILRGIRTGETER